MKMKRYSFLVAVLMMWSVGAFAQYDDLYYNPDNNVSESTTVTSPSSDQNYAAMRGNQLSSYESQNFDNDEYDYYYTSRIRRFHRPLYGFNYFDPYYTDLYYYDPFMPMGSYTAMIYDRPYSYSSWAYARAIRRAAFFNPWLFRPAYGSFYDPFFNPGLAFGYNSFYGPTFGLGFNAGFGGFGGFNPAFGFGGPAFGYGPGFGGFYGGGFGGGALYCPPSYGSAGYVYNTPTSVSRVYSPRTGTSTSSPGNVSTVDRPTRNPVRSYRNDPAVSTTNPNATINRGTRSVSPEARDNTRSAITRDRYTTTPSTRSINTNTYRTTRTRSNTFTTPRSYTPSRSNPGSFDSPTRSMSTPRMSSPSPRMSSPAPRMSSPSPSRSSGSRSRGN